MAHCSYLVLDDLLLPTLPSLFCRLVIHTPLICLRLLFPKSESRVRFELPSALFLFFPNGILFLALKSFDQRATRWIYVINNIEAKHDVVVPPSWQGRSAARDGRGGGNVMTNSCYGGIASGLVGCFDRQRRSR